MAFADQGLPPWLQRNISPSEPFDPTPWLQERFRREVIKAKLPLELQQMELANKAMNLQVETQGLQNDLVNQEMDIYAQELPALRQYMSQAESTPGGALSLRAPAFRSKKAMAAIAERQKLDAETGYGMALNRTIVEQTKNAAEWMALTGRVIRPGPDGTFNPEEYAALGTMASEMAQANEMAAIQARAGKPADEVGIEYRRMKDAETIGDLALAEFHKGRLLKMTQSTGTTIRTNPDGSVEIVQGAVVGGPDALTKPNLSKVQESQAQSLATIDVANRLEPLISAETVGVQAFAESWVKDRILAQRFPEMASGERAKAEQLASQLRASAVKELRSDSNITDGERKQIMAAIPQINDPVDSPTRAKELVRNIRKMAAIRALVAAKRMGGEAPKAAALVLDDEDLVELFNQGLITQEIAAQAYKLKRK